MKVVTYITNVLQDPARSASRWTIADEALASATPTDSLVSRVQATSCSPSQLHLRCEAGGANLHAVIHPGYGTVTVAVRPQYVPNATRYEQALFDILNAELPA